jgi:hypothetical protein
MNGFKKDFRSCKYTPKIKFKGYTECFKLLEKENIINYLTKIENDLLQY